MSWIWIFTVEAGGEVGFDIFEKNAALKP